MSKEERIYPRVNRLLLVTYVNREGEEQRTPVSMGRVLDVSAGGIGMELFDEVRVGSVMEMEVDLQDELVEVKGTVAHIRKESDRFVVGIRFSEPQERLAGAAG